MPAAAAAAAVGVCAVSDGLGAGVVAGPRDVGEGGQHAAVQQSGIGRGLRELH